MRCLVLKLSRLLVKGKNEKSIRELELTVFIPPQLGIDRQERLKIQGLWYAFSC